MRGRKRTLPEMEMGKSAPAPLGFKKYTRLNNMHMHGLTFSDVVKGPLAVLEERVAFDLIHACAAQTNLPAHSNRTKTVSRTSSASTLNTARPSPPPTTVINMSSQTHSLVA